MTRLPHASNPLVLVINKDRITNCFFRKKQSNWKKGLFTHWVTTRVWHSRFTHWPTHVSSCLPVDKLVAFARWWFYSRCTHDSSCVFSGSADDSRLVGRSISPSLCLR